MRNLGLDIVRSTAILLVVVCHASIFFENYDAGFLNYFVFSGIIGVELFFALSGFLVGNILIRDIMENKVNGGGVIIFWFRRWLRTLPIYYIVLGIIFILKGEICWEALYFFQNFKDSTIVFYPVSWSLVLEEWFYLLIPICIVFGQKMIKDNAKLLLCSGVCIIFFSLFARYIYAYLYEARWVYDIRMQPFLRMDALMCGVLAAGIKFYYPKNYERIIAKYRSFIFFSAFFMIGWCWWYFTKFYFTGMFDSSIFPKTLFFSLCSFASILAVISLENYFSQYNSARIQYVIKFVSLRSYCIYLIHFDIFFIVRDTFKNYVHMESFMFMLILSLFITVYLSNLSFKFIEQPILKYRDQYFILRRGRGYE